MKPTLEQLQEWRSQALEYAHAITNQYPSWKDAVDLKFAELAAAWGASQAQQEPCADYRAMYLKVRDELAALQQAQQTQQITEPLGFQIRRAIAAEDELRATKQTLEHAYAALQKVADAQAAIEEPELPEAVGYVTQGYFTLGDGRIVETPEGANTIPLYATPPAKMHDYAAAKVREAMARQNADAKLNYAPLYDYAQANRIDYNHLCAVVREAMQGDNHE